MSQSGRSPGVLADRTFDLGFKLAAALGLAGVASLFWAGVFSPTDVFHLTLVATLFPVYLVFSSILLGVWLGYDTDKTDLQPVSDEPEIEDPFERRR